MVCPFLARALEAVADGIPCTTFLDTLVLFRGWAEVGTDSGAGEGDADWTTGAAGAAEAFFFPFEVLDAGTEGEYLLRAEARGEVADIGAADGGTPS